ncbi:MAG TPA: peptide deformylase [Polyangia bacterium]|nr:peptide deformylase [Polyangia bacterium]
MILPIVQAGDPVLRAPARPLSLDEIRSSEIQQLIEDMKETMRAAPGVGLAAPQVGLGLQLAVIEDAPEYQANASADELAERKRAVVPFHVIINPALTLLPGEAIEFHEGCLSVDGWLALVPRAGGVRVEALNERGEDVVIEARGWHARILQHEIDHLHGILCIDRMDPRTLSSHANYSKFWRGRPLQEVREALHAPRKF